MLDRIFVKDYHRTIEIGAFAEERAVTQKLAFHVEVSLGAQSLDADDVDDILSYDHIVDAIEGTISAARFNLLESMAEDISARILVHSIVQHVDITIEKLGRIDGRLGASLRRSRGEVAAQSSELAYPPTLIIADASADTNEIQVQIAKLNQNTSAIIFPHTNSAPNTTPASQRQFALSQDIAAWKLSEQLDLPVIDSRVETQALITRGENFIRAFGKQPFDLMPLPTDFTPTGLIEWHKAHTGATQVIVLGLDKDKNHD